MTNYRLQILIIIKMTRKHVKMYKLFNFTINSLLNSPPLFLLGDATQVFLLGETAGLCCGDRVKKTFKSVSLDSFTGEGDAVVAAVTTAALIGVLEMGDLSGPSVKSTATLMFLACLEEGS